MTEHTWEGEDRRKREPWHVARDIPVSLLFEKMPEQPAPAPVRSSDLLDLSGDYGIVLADPPWSIQTTAQVPSGRPNARPYVAMRMCDIYALPVAKIAAKDSLLFLWATAPLIPEALYAMKAWGYEYKTVAFTWVKRNKGGGDGWFWGMGWWTRSNPEYCLLGMKGSPKRAAANVHSVIEAPVGEHSKKPNIVRDEIVRLCGELPRVELFARERVSGWDAWGNEV